MRTLFASPLRTLRKSWMIYFMIVALTASECSFAMHGSNRHSQRKVGHPISRLSVPLVSAVVFAAAGGLYYYLLDNPEGEASDAKGSQALRDHYNSIQDSSHVVLHATALLRFPHMLSDLMDQEEKSERKTRPSVLLLGAGIQNNKIGPEAPAVHEIAAIFPSGDLEIVDLDPRVGLAVKNGGYRTEFAQMWGNRVVKDRKNFRRFAEDAQKLKRGLRTQGRIEKLLKRIPVRIHEHADLKVTVKETFFELYQPGLFDYIIATKSLMYPLLSTHISSREKCDLVSKFHEALADDGRMYVDYQTFLLMRETKCLEPRFRYGVIHHQSAYMKGSDCSEKMLVDYDYVGCIRGGGERVGTTEDIVVITRR